jgi:flavodoxin
MKAGGGRTRKVAEAIAEAARADGHHVAVKPLAQVGRDDVRDADVLFFGTWVQGFILFGAGPARAARKSIQSLPDLKGKPAAVFCTNLVHPRGTLATFRAALEAKKAKVTGERAFHRRRLSQGTAEFARSVMAAASGAPAR